MNINELKAELFTRIDSMNKIELEQIYSLVQRLVKKSDSEPWDTLSEPQQKGILDALDELNKSDGIDHQSVIDKYRQKYA